MSGWKEPFTMPQMSVYVWKAFYTVVKPTHNWSGITRMFSKFCINDICGQDFLTSACDGNMFQYPAT